MKLERKSVLSALFFAVAISVSGLSQAQVPINLTGASTTPIGQDKIRISNVAVGSQTYDVDLQWNPYDMKFDVVTPSVRLHSNALECQTGIFSSLYANDAMIIVSQSAGNKTIKIQLTSLANDAMYGAFDDYTPTFHGVIQNGHLLGWSKKTANLNANTALATMEANYNGNGGISRGVSRTVTLSNVPTWFDFNQSIQAVVYGSKTLYCQ